MNTITAPLAIVTAAVALIPEHLPEVHSIAIYPHIAPSITWHLTDETEFEAVRDWLSSRGDDYFSDYRPADSIATRIVIANRFAVSWSLALLREQVTA